MAGGNPAAGRLARTRPAKVETLTLPRESVTLVSVKPVVE